MPSFKYLLLSLLILAPYVTFAQSPSLQKLFAGIMLLINNVLIPFLFGVAFLVFAWNVIRYFVIGASNEDDRKEAKNVAIYSVAAFVFLIIFMGIVNLLTKSTGLEGEKAPCPDYLDPQYCIDYVPPVI